MYSLSLYITLLLPLLLILHFITKRFHHKIKNLPPSPFPTLPLLGHLHLLRQPLHRTLSEISARYGPILHLRLGFRHVILVSSPAIAEECFTKKDVIFANRPRLLVGKHLGYNYNTLTWVSYGDHWRNLRRISVVELLSSHRLQILAEIRADEVKSLLGRLSRSCGDNKNVNVKTAFFEMMLNVMMKMIAGKSFYGEKVAEVKEAKQFQEIVEETFRLAGTNIVDFLPFLRYFGSFEKRLMALQDKRNNFMQGLVEETKKKKTETSHDSRGGERTMVDVLLSLQEKEPDYYTDEIIRGIMIVMLAAGSDTSVGTMEWTLSLLLNHPNILKNAQNEIDEKIGHNRLVTESDLTNLPYLHCIISESMRMYTVAPLLVPHESSENCTVSGYHVPRGTMLMVNMWAIQNSPHIWEEPDKFRPERFTEINGAREGFKFMPFGSGRRSCPGEGLALKIVGLALASVIQCFDWERPSSEMIDLSEGSGLSMPKAKPLVARCKPRPIIGNLLSLI